MKLKKENYRDNSTIYILKGLAAEFDVLGN